MPTITLLNRGNRSGTFTTPSYAVPVGTTGTWLLRTNMLESDLAATGYSASVIVEVSDDGGASWRVWAAFIWESGVVTKAGPTVHNSGVGGPIDALAGRTIRARVTLTRQTRLGFALEVMT